MPSEADRPFSILIFDLDDTLTDTEGQLVSLARQQSLREMAKSGLSVSVEQAERLWDDYQRLPQKSDVFAFIAEAHENPSERAQIAALGRASFYQRKVPSSFHCHAGVPELLSLLKTRYLLYLVTSGDVETQKKKVELTHLSPFFHAVFYVDHMSGETKARAFRTICDGHQVARTRFLVVGNRLDHEIREGKKLGFKTCWVRAGEHRRQEPVMPEDRPDYTITHPRELLQTCPL